jgi:DNA-binding phage protein
LQRALSPRGKLRLSAYLAIMKAAKLKIGIVRI